MKLEKIFIRNFRSIGEKGLELTFTPTWTTFIGENNVGKSSIFEAIKKSLEPNISWDAEEWHTGNQSKTVEIQLSCKLDDNQIKQTIAFLHISLNVTEFKEIFADKLIYEFRRESNLTLILFKLGELHIENYHGWIGDVNRSKGYKEVPIREIIEKSKSQRKKVKEIFDELENQQTAVRIYFGNNFSDYLLRLLKESIIIIEEFREKPQKTLVDFRASPTGKELASVLFNLKNARYEQRKKFNRVQEKFHQLFPTLKLDAIRENNEIKILIQKSDIESTTFYLGAGILESLLLITHVIAHSDEVLCVDHPELHLHPHAQRRLAHLADEEKDNQVLTITHSPYFVNLSKSNDVIRVVQNKAQTEIIQLPQNYFNDEDFMKLSQFLDIDSKELFFAKKVVLVEGPTELGALPIFASEIYNFDENGVSLINVGGKLGFEFFVKLCEGFKVPYLVIADNDAKEELLKLKENYPDFNSYLLPDEFDDILSEELKIEAKSILGDRSKPRIGRYVAKKLVERGEIPTEISSIIEKVKNL